jgi:hypothetical protein
MIDDLIHQELELRKTLKRQLDMPGVRARMGMMGLPIAKTLSDLLTVLDDIDLDSAAESQVRPAMLEDLEGAERRKQRELEKAAAQAKVDAAKRLRDAAEDEKRKAEQAAAARQQAREDAARKAAEAKELERQRLDDEWRKAEDALADFEDNDDESDTAGLE